MSKPLGAGTMLHEHVAKFAFSWATHDGREIVDLKFEALRIDSLFIYGGYCSHRTPEARRLILEIPAPVAPHSFGIAPIASLTLLDWRSEAREIANAWQKLMVAFLEQQQTAALSRSNGGA